jgi:hypothetical protein
LPGGAVYVVLRPEGILLTVNNGKAAKYLSPSITDDDMALILGYPESKREVLERGPGLLVQAVNRAGDIITEAAASEAGLEAATAALTSHVPKGGSIKFTTIIDALVRRIEKRRSHHGTI